MITIKHCHLFGFECPQKWGHFSKTNEDNRNVRFCDVCENKVYLCKTDEEYEKHKEAGNCVAVDYMAPGKKKPIRLAGMPPRIFPK